MLYTEEMAKHKQYDYNNNWFGLKSTFSEEIVTHLL